MLLKDRSREEAAFCLNHGEYTVELLRTLGPARERCEQDLLASGIGLPLMHRSAWTAAGFSKTSWFLAVRDPSQRCVCGLALDVTKSRALPGSVVLCVERFGSATDATSREAALLALAEIGHRYKSVLRVHVELFSSDEAVRKSVAQIVTGLGFRHDPTRLYTTTVGVDLTLNEQELFASFHKTARRHIRAVSKKALLVRPIEDIGYGPRCQELLGEAFSRTGTRAQMENWQAVITLSRTHPELSRLIGLFATDDGDPYGLLAFAWGRRHTDHVEYAVAGSTRRADLRIPFAYALAWDLMCWGKGIGATWFDFGGITPTDKQHPLGGISQFKRYFSENAIPVGEEWVFEPRPVNARVARTVSLGAGLVRWLRRSAGRAGSITS